MRTGRVCALALLALAAIPRAAGAAGAPPSWPTAADIRSYTPGLGAKDAACVARYYRGRLSRKAWLTPYFKLTPAQKPVTDAGFDHCQTQGAAHRPDRAPGGDLLRASTRRTACVARAMDARTRAQRLALTSLARQIREDDKVFRRCGLIGQLYATLGKATKLVLTPAEQRCANRVGLGRSAFACARRRPRRRERKAVGAVFDRCVGRKTGRRCGAACWRPSSPRARSRASPGTRVSITFVTFFSDATALERQAKAAAAACHVTK